ncbi:MAG TPA: exosortase/archaeosortase family protein [Candidatus Acidoferrum sp.]|jgi:exosortase|nr:exosortase/archaeosortase family protein [Candidatus Acidoferrum sp.]
MQNQTGNGILEEFRIEFLDCWQRVPNKGFFLTLLVVWLALFQWLGNSTLGYVSTKSLFYWLYDAFTAGGRSDAFEEETVGLFMPLAVLVILWLKRRQLIALELKPGWPGLLLLGAGALLHVVGYLVQQPRISVAGLFLGLYGITGLTWGSTWLRATYFPFLLFGFCMPLGSQAEIVTFPLRLLVTRLVELVCHYVLAIDVIRQGTALINPTEHYNYEVAAACSGIRSLLATMAIAVTIGFYSFGKWWKRLVVIGSAFPLAVVGNLFRMLTIVVAAELGGQEWGNTVHEGGPLGVFSLLPYVPVFLGLFWLENWLRERPASHAIPPMEAKTA